MILSLSIHAVILLLFAFLTAWREPNPPLPEYGIEINFGTSDVGSGDVQPETPVQEADADEEPAPSEETTEDVEVDEPEEVTEEVTEPVSDTEETTTEESQPVQAEDIESPDVVPPVEENTESKVETEQNTTEETENINTENPSVSGEGESEKPAEVNQGDKTDETGDQGDEQGEIDARALYGKPGSGGGSSLEMAGWIWDELPRPNDTSSESGKIVFEITIDDQGYVVSVKTLETTVSPAVVKIYRTEVERLTFSKTDNNPPAPRSTGRVTFIIKAN